MDIPKDRLARVFAILVIAVTAILVAMTAWQRAGRVRLPHVEPDRDLYPIRGIDISAHNGTVDFDSSFRRNHASARSAGLAVGAYHFFRFDCDGRRQAVNLMAAVDSCPLDLPLAIDVEEWGNAVDSPTEIVQARLQAMIDHLRSHGREVAVYTNKNGFWRFVHHKFEGTDSIGVWICSFTSPPLPGDGWTFWQHSHQGRVRGVRGPVDLNTFRGDSSAWRTRFGRLQ